LKSPTTSSLIADDGVQQVELNGIKIQTHKEPAILVQVHTRVRRSTKRLANFQTGKVPIQEAEEQRDSNKMLTKQYKRTCNQARSSPTSTAKSSIALSSSIFVIIATLSGTQVAIGSPPIDYFVYTSQLATAQQGTQNIVSILPSLESIYLPAARENVSSSSEKQRADDRYLVELANRVLSLVKNTSHSHDNDMIDLEATRYAWHLMEKQALLYVRNRVLTLKPFIKEILSESQVSNGCQQSVSVWLDKLVDLEQWASLMWNSWGEFPPSGLFEGSFTDLGSYRGCLNVEDNEFIGQSQYCTLDYQPLVPTRPRFHSIFKRILDVDGRNGRLTGGDFRANRISSQHSAHGFSSARFNQDRAQTGEDGDPSSSSSINIKYSKRTIVHNGTSEDLLAPKEQFSASNLTLKTGVSLPAQTFNTLAGSSSHETATKFSNPAFVPLIHL